MSERDVERRRRGIYLGALKRRLVKLSTVERDCLTVSCPRCQQSPGAWCLTSAGHVSPSLHLDRLDRSIPPL